MASGERSRLRRVTSRQNALVKQLRQAFTRGERTENGLCAIEGVRLLDEAIRSGLRFQAVFFSESAEERANRLLPQIGAQVETLLLPDEVFASAVSTETPQGVAALVRLKHFDWDDLLRGPDPLVIAAAGIQDPGNLGTIVRSAEAFEAQGVLVGENTVSEFNPKAVRASAGSMFRVPVVRAELAAAAQRLRSSGVRLLATSSHKGTPVDEAQLTGAVAVFIGSEGAGVPRDVLREMDEVIAIPHSARVESLNAGVAAAVVLYEAARQRRKT
jgi:TrmH family RNA methyltransferase